MSNTDQITQVKGGLGGLKVPRGLLFKGLPRQQLSSGVEEFGIKWLLKKQLD